MRVPNALQPSGPVATGGGDGEWADAALGGLGESEATYGG